MNSARTWVTLPVFPVRPSTLLTLASFTCVESMVDRSVVMRRERGGGLVLYWMLGGGWRSIDCVTLIKFTTLAPFLNFYAALCCCLFVLPMVPKGNRTPDHLYPKEVSCL